MLWYVMLNAIRVALLQKTLPLALLLLPFDWLILEESILYAMGCSLTSVVEAHPDILVSIFCPISRGFPRPHARPFSLFITYFPSCGTPSVCDRLVQGGTVPNLNRLWVREW